MNKKCLKNKFLRPVCFYTSYQSKTKKRVRYQYEIRSQSSKSLNHSTDSEYDNFPKKSSSKNRKNLIKNSHLSKSQPTSLNVLPPHMQAAMRYNMYWVVTISFSTARSKLKQFILKQNSCSILFWIANISPQQM